MDKENFLDFSIVKEMSISIKEMLFLHLPSISFSNSPLDLSNPIGLFVLLPTSTGMALFVYIIKLELHINCNLNTIIIIQVKP
jgi:hypothetical protein